MSFTSPLALWALLAVPAVLLLHLFRRRYEPRRVAGLFLFAPDALTASAGRQRTPLTRSTSLWLELAAAVALALWLAGPRLVDAGASQHFVVVLDDSASMRARGRDGAAFVARARALVRAELQRLRGGARVTLIATGPRPSVLLGPAAAAGLAAAALEKWQPQRVQHDFAPALGLAVELGGPQARVWFVTDTPLPAPPRGVAVRAVGERVDNVSLVHVRRLLRDDGERLFVDVVAHADAPCAPTLRVQPLGEPRELVSQRLELTPDRLARVEVTLPEPGLPLEVALEPDALDLDDRHVLLPEPLRPVLVSVTLGDDAARQLQFGHALRALGKGVRLATGDADLEIVAAPSEGAWTAQLVVDVGQEPYDAWIGPFLFDRRHPLLRGVTLEGVIWGAGSARASDARGLVFAGDRALLSEEHLGERVRWHLALAPSRSNLPTSPDWPILLVNAVEQVRARLPGAAQVNLRSGDVLTWRRAPGEDARADLELVDADGVVVRGRGARTVTFEPQRAGRHVLRSGTQPLAQVAVNFVDARESDLRGCASAEIEATPFAADTEAATAAQVDGSFERRWLAFLLLALLALDWWVLAPRAAKVTT